MTDGRQRGLTKIKNILSAFEGDSAFQLGDDGSVSMKEVTSPKNDDPMRSAQGTVVTQSVAGGFQTMIEQSRKMLFDLKTMEESHQKVAPAEILKFEDIEELPEASASKDADLEPIAETSELNLGNDPLQITDLAFQEFAARKATIISNVEAMASARQDMDESTKKAVVQEV